MISALSKALVRHSSPSQLITQNILGSELDRALGFSRQIGGRTHVIVDNSNILFGSRASGRQVDYKHGVPEFLGGDELVSASIVVTQPPRPRANQACFYAFLAQSGWCVFRHRHLENNDGGIEENEQLVDGDVRKLIRAAANSATCDSIVVLSGDGGMTNAARDARRAGKKVYVVAWEGTLHPALAAVATAHTTVESLLPLIGRVLH